MLTFSEPECPLGLDFHHLDALFSNMQLRFPNSKTVRWFHSRKRPSEPTTDNDRVTARETTFIPVGHGAIILGDFTTRTNPRAIWNHPPHFARNVVC